MLIEQGGEGKAFFGVLEVDSADAGRFDEADADFLADFAGLLEPRSNGSRLTPSFRRRSSIRRC